VVQSLKWVALGGKLKIFLRTRNGNATAFGMRQHYAMKIPVL
jgi:hypothetical protein